MYFKSVQENAEFFSQGEEEPTVRAKGTQGGSDEALRKKDKFYWTVLECIDYNQNYGKKRLSAGTHSGNPEKVVMLRFEGKRVYLACGKTDMRKSIDGLAAIVEGSFKLNPFNDALFVFCNRKRDRIVSVK